MDFRCLDNNHLVGDGMGDALGIVVRCLTCFSCGFV